MAAELPRPGVEVIQVFRSVSPTIVTPTLPPCCVGVCKQVVDVLATSSGTSTLNGDALVPLSAGFLAKAGTGTPAAYGGLDGKKLALSINFAPTISILFSGASLSPTQVVATILAAFAAQGVTAAVAEVVGSRFQVRTVGANEFQVIKVIGSGLDASDVIVLSAFGLGPDKEYFGASGYAQDALVVSPANLPDPRKNLSQLAVDFTSIRAFLYMGGIGGTLTEVRRDKSFLRSGQALAASTLGGVVLSTLTYGVSATVDGKTLILSVNGAVSLTVTFAAPADIAALLAQVNTVVGSVAKASLDSTGKLLLTTVQIGADATLTIGAGTANSDLGLSPGAGQGTTAIKAIDSGSGASVTSLLEAPGANFTEVASAAVVTGSVSIAAGVDDGLTLILNDGSGPQTLSFLDADSAVTVLAQINGLFGSSAGGAIMATVNGSNHLVLTHSKLGAEASLMVVGGTALETALGLTVGASRGSPYPPAAGDELYIDGSLFGIVTQVAPGGVVTRLRIDRQVPLSPSLGLSYYLVAKNLPVAGRPSADLALDLSGNIILKQDLIRDTLGNPSPARAQIYLAYQAVRQDVSALSKNPGLLRFSDTTTLSDELAPINGNNPLALGLYFALLNASGIQVTGLGVDQANAGSPFGTVEAFARAATFLEGYDVYAIAPLSHESGVAQLFSAHVTAMSAPDQKRERIALANPSAPTSRPDVLVGSGLNGNTTTTTGQFDTGIANLGALLLAKSISPVGPLLVAAGVYLDVGNGKKYSVVSVSGSIVTVKTSAFLSGDNDDGYYATTALASPLIAQPFAVRIRGALLVRSDGTPDKDGVAVTYQQMARSYQNRRLWHVLPDKAGATLEGIEQVVEGFYLSAAIAGMIGKLPPHQSFTNYPMTGFTRVLGTSDYLSERQLNIAAAGGNYIVVQDAPGAALTARMALTTDMTSIETRTDSITKIVDFTAKFLRQGLRNFIGRFNITQGFLDSLGHVIQGLGGFLVESGILVGFNLNNIIQDESAPDTVLIDVTLDVPFPCNYIRLTLVI